jgi:hypothetical protein
MPRRQTTTDREIPLYLIPHMITKRIRRHGDALERIIVCKSGSHYNNISIRTRRVKRDLRPCRRPVTAGDDSTAKKCGDRTDRGAA